VKRMICKPPFLRCTSAIRQNEIEALAFSKVDTLFTEMPAEQSISTDEFQCWDKQLRAGTRIFR